MIKNIAENKQNGLPFLFNNIDGLTTNFDLFSAKLSNLKSRISVISVAETNINKEHKDLFRIPGYESIFQSKLNNKKKGSGLGIYLEETFISNEISNCCICTNDIESLFINIVNTSEPITFGVIYRPPTGNVANFISQLEKIMSFLPNSNSIITGDFNINFLADHTNNSDLRKFENIFYGNCYIPLISLATHHKPGCKPSALDNILVNSHNNVIMSGVLDLHVSHHNPIVCILNDVIVENTINTTQKLPRYDYCETNLIKFNEKLSNQLNNLSLPYTEDGFNNFMECFVSSIDDCFLVDQKIFKSKRNRLLNPWITNGIINSINQNQFLYKTWKKSTKNKNDKDTSDMLYKKYSDFRKKLKYLINSAKRLFYLNKFDKAEGNSKKTWDLINKLRGKNNTKNKAMFLVDGSVIKDHRIIANKFNEYFVSVASNMNNSFNDVFHDGIPITDIPDFDVYINNFIKDSIYMNDCSENEIAEIICDLNGNKSSDIPLKVLKSCSKIIAPYLCKFYNYFMENGTFPQILKLGQITPIFKKGNTQLMENYRPVSTLPCFGKIFEKLIFNRFYNFIISKNILYENQFGFRRKHSTSNAINHSIDKIVSDLENKHHVIGIFIDLSKAFDTICHQKLLIKLEKYGIRGTPLKLIRDYISSRTQIVNFNGTKSNPQPVSYGVPQGSVLGPLLFILYINDIVNSCKSAHLVLFADDTNIFVTAKTEKEAYEAANKCINDIYLYMLANQLHINLEKSVYVHFKPHINNEMRKTCSRARKYNTDYSISINGKKLLKTDKVRFLGVIIDEHLNWESHLNYLEQKLNSCIVIMQIYLENDNQIYLENFLQVLLYMKVA